MSYRDAVGVFCHFGLNLNTHRYKSFKGFVIVVLVGAAGVKEPYQKSVFWGGWYADDYFSKEIMNKEYKNIRRKLFDWLIRYLIKTKLGFSFFLFNGVILGGK